MHIIDCKAIAATVLNESTIERLKDRVLHVVMKNKNPDNLSYLKSIYKMAKNLGVSVPVYSVPNTVPLSDAVNTLMGIKPLPDNEKILFLGYNEEEVTELWRGSPSLNICQVLDNPMDRIATRAVCLSLYNVMSVTMILPKRTTIIGRSELAIGCGTDLLKCNHTVTFVHTKTEDMADYLKDADIIVSFAGSPNLITGDMVKDGSIIISVGCSMKDGKLCGDIDMNSMQNKNVAVTPTLGGIGALTTALLFSELAK